MQGNWLHDLAADSLGNFEISDELDRRLSRLCDALPGATNRQCSIYSGNSPGRLSGLCVVFATGIFDPFDLDDVVQESYLVFVDTITRWLPHYVDGWPAGYLYYFLRVFPLWLANRVRGWKRRTRPPIVRSTQSAKNSARSRECSHRR